MEQKRFEAMLVLLIPQVIHLITDNDPYDEGKRLAAFSS